MPSRKGRSPSQDHEDRPPSATFTMVLAVVTAPKIILSRRFCDMLPATDVDMRRWRTNEWGGTTAIMFAVADSHIVTAPVSHMCKLVVRAPGRPSIRRSDNQFSHTRDFRSPGYDAFFDHRWIKQSDEHAVWRIVLYHSERLLVMSFVMFYVACTASWSTVCIFFPFSAL